MSSRETPELPSDFFFDKDEIKALNHIKYGNNLETNEAITIKESINMISKLGGHVKGKKKSQEWKLCGEAYVGLRI